MARCGNCRAFVADLDEHVSNPKNDYCRLYYVLQKGLATSSSEPAQHQPVATSSPSSPQTPPNDIFTLLAVPTEFDVSVSECRGVGGSAGGAQLRVDDVLLADGRSNTRALYCRMANAVASLFHTPMQTLKRGELKKHLKSIHQQNWQV